MFSQPEAPLSESTYFILLSLSPMPKHGYAIMKDVRELSEERIVLSTDPLYVVKVFLMLKFSPNGLIVKLSSGRKDIRSLVASLFQTSRE